MTTLNLITGNPGNGKTLHTLQIVEKQRLEAITEKNDDGTLRYPNGRAVYQNGIHGLTLPWLPLEDPRKWYECPNGSIVVIDEAWRAFPMRKPGDVAPRYIEEFATHRHHGFDIYLITQHRHQIDTFVRKMVTRHIHLERKHGAEHANVWQWEKETDTNSSKRKEEALKTSWAYPKEIYNWYKSAEIHTVRKDFPWLKFWWMPPLAVLVIVLFVYGIHRLRHMGDVTGVTPASPAGAATGPGPIVRGAIWRPGTGKPREWDVLGSAERYDQNYKIATVPAVAGCMQMEYGHKVTCTCSGVAGDRLPFSTFQCMELVRNGWFDPSQKYDDVKRANINYLNMHEGTLSGGEPDVRKNAPEHQDAAPESKAPQTAPIAQSQPITQPEAVTHDKK